MELARRDEQQRRVTESLEKARASLEPGRGSKRKRKKRRKRRLPRSSVPRGGRGRRHWQWLVPGWFSWSSALHAVFPSYVGRPQLPGIIVGMVRDDSLLRSSSTPTVASAWLVMLVFLLALCSSLSLAGRDARHHGRCAHMGQLCALFWQCHVQGSFCVYFAPRAVFFFFGPCRQARR